MSDRNPALQVAAALRPFSDRHSLSWRITDYLQNPRTRLRGRFDGDMLSGEANVPTREVSWLCDITPQNFSTCQLMSLF
jgi:hypothetical protein